MWRRQIFLQGQLPFHVWFAPSFITRLWLKFCGRYKCGELGFLFSITLSSYGQGQNKIWCRCRKHWHRGHRSLMLTSEIWKVRIHKSLLWNLQHFSSKNQTWILLLLSYEARCIISTTHYRIHFNFKNCKRCLKQPPPPRSPPPLPRQSQIVSCDWHLFHIISYALDLRGGPVGGIFKAMRGNLLPCDDFIHHVDCRRKKQLKSGQTWVRDSNTSLISAGGVQSGVNTGKYPEVSSALWSGLGRVATARVTPVSMHSAHH